MKAALTLALAVLVALTFGCGRDENAAKSAGKAPHVSIEKGVDLPADFPSDVPMPRAGTLQLAMSQGGKTLVQLYTPDTVADAGRFYQAALESGGWRIEGTEKSGDTYVIFAKKGKASCDVAVSKDGKKTLVKLTVTQANS